MAHPVTCCKRFQQPNHCGKQYLNAEKQRNRDIPLKIAHKQISNQGTIHRKLQVGGMKNQTQIKPAVVQNHNFMNHGQFQMRFRIIHRHTAVFDHGNHHQHKSSHYTEGIRYVGPKMQ